MEGTLEKMQSVLNRVVQYKLLLGNNTVELNRLIGKTLRIEFLNQIICMHCGKTTKKSFGQGYCYPCFTSIPQTEECVLRPERCRAHEGIARDLGYATNHCLIDHYVYLANTGGLKVGVTRHHQIPTRWIDQGASEAIILAKTPNRYLAGTVEVALKTVVPDKTNWRKMLSGIPVPIDLSAEKDRIGDMLPFNMQEYLDFSDEPFTIPYPVHQYPKKIKGISLDKNPVVEGTLTGIKGQYLIFEDGRVMNVRKHGGYNIKLEIT